MIDINPILSTPKYPPAVSNINATMGNGAATTTDTTITTNNVDPRRYTKFDRTATEAGTADMSFSDLLDTINPLEHIPVVSAVYRAIVGEDIHPVARVAGDIIYGGAMGIASAVVGTVTAIGDTIMQSQTGTSMAGGIAVALLGDEPPAATQIATQTSEPTIKVAEQSAPPAAPAPEQAQVANSQPMAVPPLDPTNNSAVTTTLSPATQAITGGFPLDRNKMAFGGVMELSPLQQSAAIAAHQGAHPMQLGHTLYTGRMMTGVRNAPATASVASPDTTPRPAVASTNTPTPSGGTSTQQGNPLNYTASGISKSLIDDLIKLRELKNYPAIAANPTLRGTTVDLSN